MAILSWMTDIGGFCKEQSAKISGLFLSSGRKLAVNVICVVLSSLALSGFVNSQTGPDEYEVKAAFLYNFAKFIEWPADTFPNQNAPLVVGILGGDPFKGYLNQIGGKTANGRQVVIRRLNAGQDLRSCHILFIGSSERKRLDQIIASLKGSSVLTVGEMDAFATSGGIIGLIMEGKNVRFMINGGAAERARLRISSRLLSLATKIVY